MKNVILAGNAKTAEILSSYIELDSRYRIVAMTVHDQYVDGADNHEIETIALSELKNRYSPEECSVIMAMGYSEVNAARARMFSELGSLGYTIETYVHPDACVYTNHPIGEGSVILPNAVIEPHAQIGCNTMIWCNSTVAHHSIVGNHCWIASGAVLAGETSIEDFSFIGVNVTVVNKVKIAASNIIGAGALITKNTEPESVHLMRSAERIRFKSADYAKFFGF